MSAQIRKAIIPVGVSDERKTKGLEILSGYTSLIDKDIVDAKERQEKSDALAEMSYNSEMSAINSSQGALDRKNYLAYRRLVDMYLPEYLNSSGLYDAGSMAQAFLDAKNGYINKSEDISREYDAQRLKARNALNKSKADSLAAYNDEIKGIDDGYQGVRDELMGYIEVAASSGEEAGTWDFDAIENFADTYASDLETLKEKRPDYYNQVARMLNAYVNSAAYQSAYEDKVEADAAEAKTKAEQERIENIQANVINLADEGYTVVGGDGIKKESGKNFDITKKLVEAL